jgi:hypothetical protein
MKFTAVEYDILNTLYFVEPFSKIVEEVGGDPNIIRDSLRQLITHKYVSPMKWDEKKKSFVRSIFYDSDDMEAFNYIATKEGLLAHTNQSIEE